ncbi:phenoloxidase-activating factor 2-like [Anopheles merus]|uniref:Phenoloxidase-activating factor 2 n=1 Tax=Anopheles merus TaxID=30066 RepID=A0A182USM6_ANOME|nr:phenoloxidase-activating factor 2-like [Anopheles merus]
MGLWRSGVSAPVLVLVLGCLVHLTRANYTLDDVLKEIDPVAQSQPCSGECVPFFLCKENGIITDGEGIIDVRVGEETGAPCHYLEECCEQRSVRDQPPPGAIKPNGIKRELGKPTCGVRNSNGIGFRLSSNPNGEAEFGEFPWMVAVLLDNPIGGSGDSFNLYQGGGSLIAPNVVLTAAHIVYNKQKDKLILRAGEWDTQTRNELYKHQDRQVYQVITHEAFNKGSLANDVALVILTDPFLLAENIQPICLPPRGTTFDYQHCFASGWGKDQFGKAGKYQVILKKIELPVVPHANCQEALRTTRLGRRFALHQSFLCAGGVAGQDTCRGDGGSPLVCPIPGSPTHYYQAGIVAWGIGCGTDGIPGVYASVSVFRGWIDEKLLEHNILARDYVYTS